MKTGKALIYIDMAYTAKIVRSRKHEQFWHARHSGGYFSRVWGVHPLSDIAAGNDERRTKFIRFSPTQLVIEGVAESLPLPRFLLPVNFLVSQARLLWLLVSLTRRRGIDAILATDPLYSGLFGLALKVFTRKPLIVCVYMNLDSVYEATGALGSPRLFRRRRVEQFVTRTVLTRADLAVVGSADTMEFIRRYGATEEKSALIPVPKFLSKEHYLAPELRSGPEADFHHFGIPQGRRYLLFIGRHLELKHPDDAIKAMKVVIEEEPDVVGIVTSDGPMRPRLEEMVREWGMEKSIFFTGLIDQEALSRIIPHCIVISPLTGMALIESGLGGAPAVAYDVDWHREFIRDGINGYLVPFRDADALAIKSLEILRDADLRSALSDQMRRDALAFADLETIHQEEHRAFDAMFDARGN
jgi:glycosyltransferase involved in cell wall biosynthesis